MNRESSYITILETESFLSKATPDARDTSDSNDEMDEDDQGSADDISTTPLFSGHGREEIDFICCANRILSRTHYTHRHLRRFPTLLKKRWKSGGECDVM